MLTPLSEEGYDVYLYDQLGGGHSSRLADITGYTADRHKKDLEEIVKKIGAQKVILMGHSWGAILAVLYIADNPGKVEKLILTGPGPIMPAHRELAKLKAPDSLHLREPYYTNRQGNDLANNIRTKAMAFFALRFGKKLASDKEADDFGGYLGSLVDRSTVCDTARIGEIRPAPGAGFYCQVMTMKSLHQVQDPRPKIKGLPIPLLVMKGQCDNQKWGFTHEYLDLFPDHRLVIIPDAGHSISAEQPVLYLATIRDFLNR
jgi:proline iminopeptidase